MTSFFSTYFKENSSNPSTAQKKIKDSDQIPATANCSEPLKSFRWIISDGNTVF
jgi:hypothetical protein